MVRDGARTVDRATPFLQFKQISQSLNCVLLGLSQEPDVTQGQQVAKPYIIELNFYP